MKKIGEYRLYKIYEVSEEEREITGATGSRYIRNSILVFRPDEINPKLGNEWRCASSEEEAKVFIDADNPKVSLHEQLKRAEARSREQELNESRKREDDTEAERRRRERQGEYYSKDIEKNI